MNQALDDVAHRDFKFNEILKSHMYQFYFWERFSALDGIWGLSNPYAGMNVNRIIWEMMALYIDKTL